MLEALGYIGKIRILCVPKLLCSSLVIIIALVPFVLLVQSV